MSAVPEEERFSMNTVIMAQAVHESITRLFNAGYKTVNPTIVAFAIGVIQTFDKHYLIQGFIENCHPPPESWGKNISNPTTVCWDNIKQRDETFFVNNASNIFKYLPMDKVNLFKDLFTTVDTNGKCVISQSLKDQIWDLFDSMIKISIKYIHKNRGPYSIKTNPTLGGNSGINPTTDGIMDYYSAEFFQEVNLEHHAYMWSVQLDFPLRI